MSFWTALWPFNLLYSCSSLKRKSKLLSLKIDRCMMHVPIVKSWWVCSCTLCTCSNYVPALWNSYFKHHNVANSLGTLLVETWNISTIFVQHIDVRDWFCIHKWGGMKIHCKIKCMVSKLIPEKNFSPWVKMQCGEEYFGNIMIDFVMNSTKLHLEKCLLNYRCWVTILSESGG